MKALLSNLTVFGDPIDVGALEQIKTCLKHESARGGALMADHHLGYSMPIGGVVSYEDAISPTGVGFDIACGNKAVKTNLHITDFVDDGMSLHQGVKPLMREIQRKVAFGIGRSNADPIDHLLFEDPLWRDINAAFGGNNALFQKARAQLGTVGSGNHYVDLLVDDEGNLWVANHFGSRGLGHTIASGFMAKHAGRNFTDRVPESDTPVVLSTDSELGAFYIEAMRLAGEYAYAGRDYVMEQVLHILGAEARFSVHNHHNYAWLEEGRWVVRKGATPLTFEPAFIGGSMGDPSAIVRWTGEEVGNIGSAPHGAGRLMSRTKAAGKLRKMWTCKNRDCHWAARAEAGNSRRLYDGTEISVCPECGSNKLVKARMRDKSDALIDWDVARSDLSARGIVVLGAGADEAPGVYKSLADVIEAHPNIEVLHKLDPIGVVMAGADEFDPYKD